MPTALAERPLNITGPTVPDPEALRRENLAFAAGLGIIRPAETPAAEQPSSIRRSFAELATGSSSTVLDTIIHRGIRIHGIRRDVVSEQSAEARLDGMATIRVNTANGSEIVIPNGNPSHVETSYPLNETTVETTSDATRFVYPTFVGEKDAYLAETNIEITSRGITKQVTYTPGEGNYNILPHMQEKPRESMFLLTDREDGKPTNYSLIGAERTLTDDGVRYTLPAEDNLTSTTVITFDLTPEGITQTTRIVPIGKLDGDPTIEKARELQRDPTVQAAREVQRRRQAEVTTFKKEAAAAAQEAALAEQKRARSTAAAERRRVKAVEEAWTKAEQTRPANEARLTRLFGTAQEQPRIATIPDVLHSAEVNRDLGVDLATDQRADLTVTHALKLVPEFTGTTAPEHDVFAVTSLPRPTEQTDVAPQMPAPLIDSMVQRIDTVNSIPRTGPALRTRSH